LELSIKALVTKADTRRTYVPIPKYPASYEDIAFIVPPKTPVGPMMAKIKTLDPLIKEVTLFDSYKNIRTFHIVYQSSIKNLSAEDVVKIREKILHAMKMTYNATLKTV